MYVILDHQAKARLSVLQLLCPHPHHQPSHPRLVKEQCLLLNQQMCLGVIHLFDIILYFLHVIKSLMDVKVFITFFIRFGFKTKSKSFTFRDI